MPKSCQQSKHITKLFTMKKLLNLFLSATLVSLILVLPSCQKESVEKNPVTQLNFGSKTIPAGGLISLPLTGFDKVKIANSLILSYGEVAGHWYPIPGWSPNGSSQLRSFIKAEDPSSNLTIRMVSGSIGVTFDNLHVIIIPADKLITGRTATLPFDSDNYESVRNYFNLPL